MNYKIIVDSCCELTDDMKVSGNFEAVPLSIDIDGYHIIDDVTFNQADFLKKVAESKSCPKSTCPVPGVYMEKYRCNAERIYVVTLSAEVSGSYNSAVTGKNLYDEECGDKNIHIFNSRSASAGETLIAMKIEECEEAVKNVEDSIHKTLIITHCNCLERAIQVKDMILSKIELKNIIILDTMGISSMYANDGGIIIAV